MNDVKITSMDRHQDFAEWLNELLEREAEEAGHPSGFHDHYIGLTSELGDWVGGLRFYVRGGVAHLLDLAVAESHRGQGHAHTMLRRSRSGRRRRAPTWPSSGPTTSAPSRSSRRSAGSGWYVVPATCSVGPGP